LEARLVAQIFNLPYRRIIFGRVLGWSQALAGCDATQITNITNLRYGAARQSRTKGSQLSEPQHSGSAAGVCIMGISNIQRLLLKK
jgi:hypothetical protein